jgi:hypothetical protein
MTEYEKRIHKAAIALLESCRHETMHDALYEILLVMAQPIETCPKCGQPFDGSCGCTYSDEPVEDKIVTCNCKVDGVECKVHESTERKKPYCIICGKETEVYCQQCRDILRNGGVVELDEMERQLQQELEKAREIKKEIEKNESASIHNSVSLSMADNYETALQQERERAELYKAVLQELEQYLLLPNDNKLYIKIKNVLQEIQDLKKKHGV